MNLLQMTRKLCDVAGVNEPDSLADLDFYQNRCMQWIIDSWVEIQTEKCSLWSFLRGRTTFSLAIEKDNYTVAELNVDNFARMLVGNTRLFDGAEFVGDLINIIPDEMLRLQETRPDTGMSKYWSVLDGFALALYPSPAQVYQIKFDYYEKPVYLGDGTDVPNISDEHHQIIVDLGSHKYSITDNNPELEVQSLNDFESKLNRLKFDHCPQITTSRGKQSQPGLVGSENSWGKCCKSS